MCEWLGAACESSHIPSGGLEDQGDVAAQGSSAAQENGGSLRRRAKMTERCRIPPPTHDHPETRCCCKPVGAPRDRGIVRAWKRLARVARALIPDEDGTVRSDGDARAPERSRNCWSACGISAAADQSSGQAARPEWTAQNETDRWTAPYACHRRSSTVVTARTHRGGAAGPDWTVVAVPRTRGPSATIHKV